LLFKNRLLVRTIAVTTCYTLDGAFDNGAPCIERDD
jgi:hypothetical protein